METVIRPVDDLQPLTIFDGEVNEQWLLLKIVERLKKNGDQIFFIKQLAELRQSRNSMKKYGKFAKKFIVIWELKIF